MCHGQRQEDLNLGMGEIYYGLGRLIRPSHAVVIGSYRGFVPAVIAQSLRDNAEGGEVIFIDPSFVDNFWCDRNRVLAHFKRLGTPNIRHFRQTTQQFVNTVEHTRLHRVGLLMVDGLHTAEQARFDYLSFVDKLTEDAVVLFHDSISTRESRIYGEDRAYVYSVCKFIDRLKRTPGLEVFTLPFERGLTLVRGRPKQFDIIDAPFDGD